MREKERKREREREREREGKREKEREGKRERKRERERWETERERERERKRDCSYRAGNERELGTRMGCEARRRREVSTAMTFRPLACDGRSGNLFNNRHVIRGREKVTRLRDKAGVVTGR